LYLRFAGHPDLHEEFSDLNHFQDQKASRKEGCAFQQVDNRIQKKHSGRWIKGEICGNRWELSKHHRTLKANRVHPPKK